MQKWTESNKHTIVNAWTENANDIERPLSCLWSVQIQYFTQWNITNTQNWFDLSNGGALNWFAKRPAKNDDILEAASKCEK